MIFRSCCCNPKNTFAGGPSNLVSKITQGSLVYGSNPRKIEEDAIGSLSGLETSPAAGSGRDRTGSAPRRREGLAWVDWRWGSGRRWRRRAPMAGWPPAGRRSWNSGSVWPNVGQRADGKSSLGCARGPGVEGRRWFGAEGGVPRRRRLWRPAERRWRLADEQQEQHGVARL
jgi:hypothetical protein